MQEALLLRKGVPSGTPEIGAQGGVHELIVSAHKAGVHIKN
jgi:hypothetical protein